MPIFLFVSFSLHVSVLSLSPSFLSIAVSVSQSAVVLLLLAAVVTLPGCAGSAGGEAALLPTGPYTLTPEELALDCRKLTGRLQVRLLALRGEEYKVQPSSTAQSMRSATSAALTQSPTWRRAIRWV